MFKQLLNDLNPLMDRLLSHELVERNQTKKLQVTNYIYCL